MTRKLRRLCLVNLILSWLMPFLSYGQPANAVVGTWLTHEKDAHIQIMQQGNKIVGKLVWARDAKDASGKPKVDTKNPTARLRSQPVLGMQFMHDFSYTGNNQYDHGTIYDARNGKTYKCKLTLTDKNTLDVRGYVGAAWMGLGRTTTWTRVN
jgi:uncharacterized protein (DUF2147 family)